MDFVFLTLSVPTVRSSHKGQFTGHCSLRPLVLNILSFLHLSHEILGKPFNTVQSQFPHL